MTSNSHWLYTYCKSFFNLSSKILKLCSNLRYETGYFVPWFYWWRPTYRLYSGWHLCCGNVWRVAHGGGVFVWRTLGLALRNTRRWPHPGLWDTPHTLCGSGRLLTCDGTCIDSCAHLLLGRADLAHRGTSRHCLETCK